MNERDIKGGGECGVNRERETWINLSLSFHFI